MRGVLRKAMLVVVGLSALFAVGVWGFYRASRQEPEFYQAALRVGTSQHEQAGDALEQGVLDLHNQAREAGRWEAVFTDEQLNGWLATDLTEKFPRLLPSGAKDPRIEIRTDQIRIACRYQRGKVETVISLAVDVHLTDKTNTLAVRISKLRAGALPVPLKRFLNRISRAARRSDIALRWKVQDGDPLALITVPVRHEDYAHREIYIDAIELRDGAIYLAGNTQRADNQLMAQRESDATTAIQR